MLRVVGLILSLAFGEHVELNVSFDQETNRNMNLNIQVEKETVSLSFIIRIL